MVAPAQGQSGARGAGEDKHMKLLRGDRSFRKSSEVELVWGRGEGTAGPFRSRAGSSVRTARPPSHLLRVGYFQPEVAMLMTEHLVVTKHISHPTGAVCASSLDMHSGIVTVASILVLSREYPERQRRRDTLLIMALVIAPL